MVRALLLSLLVMAGCSAPSASADAPPAPCSLDADCAKGRYCSNAGVCRSDCAIDAHCYGPSMTAQCNAQGKCIETIDAASPPADDAATTKPDAPLPEGGA